MNPRGQGTLELAIGLTLFVPVLMMGWSFAESGFLSLKAHEAADSALWDSTADPSGGGLEKARADAQQRYGGKKIGAAAQGSSITIECSQSAVAMTQPALVEQVLPAPQGSTCTARSTTRIFGGLEVPQCSSGRPDGFNGPCGGELVLAMQDGALADQQNCDVTDDGSSCANNEYWRKAKLLYEQTGAAQGKDALSLALAVLNVGAGGLPLGAKSSLDFYLSSWGEDAPTMPFAQDNKHQADGEDKRWFTTPFQQPSQSQSAWGARSSCYLGAYCDAPSIEKP